MDDEARQNLKDSFAHDMAKHQQLTGKMPTPGENERLAVPFFEELEQKLEQETPVAVEVDQEVDDAAHRKALQAEAAKRGRPDVLDRASIVRLPDQEPVAVPASPEDLERGLRMVRRLELLLSKPERGVLGAPSWRERALAVIALKKFGGDPRRTAYELTYLCEASIPSFGPWDVPEGEGRPLLFT